MSGLLAGLSALDAGLQITNQYIAEKDTNPNALGNALFNGAGALARISIADSMAERGNFWGYTINSFFPYTDSRANSFALGASLMPWRGLGCGGYGPFMSRGGFGFMPWSGGFGFGGGFHHHHCHGGGPSTIIIRA